MKRRSNSLRTAHKGTFTRLLAVILCFVMMSGVVTGVTGCKFIEDLTNGFNVAQKYLSESELARLMANAIASESSVGDCYAQIPSNQLNGLSYSIFAEYCSVLRKSSQVHGTPDSFKILNESEKWNYFLKIDSGEDERIQSVDAYGDMDVVELSYSKDKAPNAPKVRFTIAKKGDSYSMAGDYITDSMLAYSYMNHYFEMIDEYNIDGLGAIIKSTYNADIYLNSVIDAKAEYIADYYKMKVKTDTSGYELDLLSPTHVSYIIPEVFSSDGASISSKTVELYLTVDDEYLISDDFPASINETRFYKNYDFKLRMGSSYSDSEVRSLLGEPLLTTSTSDQVILIYEGVTLSFETKVSGSGHWSSGKLQSIHIRKASEFSFGDDLCIGMNISELLLIYPMFDGCDYSGTFKNDNGTYRMSFNFDDYGNVTRINLDAV